MMKRFQIVTLCALVVFLCGCINMMYTRNPLSSARINSIFESTDIAWTLSYVVAFPQTVGLMRGGDLMVENLISVPCGCVVLVDAACEAVIDTVCLPVDWPLSRYRSKKWHEWQNTMRKRSSYDDL